MRMIDCIEKKKQGEILSKAEIEFIITGYIQKQIPDYQMSALLMAIYFNGMNHQEIYHLTDTMLHSGDVIDLSHIQGIKVDKHSTGGVGDKTSLVVGPLVASFGIKMAKMSGRGLGHTGGTLDKLESIPGFTIELSPESFYQQVNDIGIAIVGQTQEVVPADKLLYALRDVTGTVDSIPLIASSIMSKKLASGADVIALDVKVGSGAFMKSVDEARKLAETMVELGELAGKKTIATLTDMSEPLGCAVGNALEVIEAIETLKGRGPKDFTELCISLTAEILETTGFETNHNLAVEKAKDALTQGRGLACFRQMVAYQQGDAGVIDDYTLLPSANEIIELKYEGAETGYIEAIDALTIGEAAMLLGAGRSTKEEDIDPAVGIYLNKKVGDRLVDGETLVTLYVNGKQVEEATQLALSAYVISTSPVNKQNIIIETMKK
ncbi:MAG: pyrimidine-nucleoside phosphorylase [Prevotella sp.]|nr:pyrimidine-nucleoside phosphorylase [Staphylococcus sp.]MCM1349596.1 pyrimidine-nucleoside phosphorylase [Prevotella sp.]